MNCFRNITNPFRDAVWLRRKREPSAENQPTVFSTLTLIKNLHAHQVDGATNTPYFTHPMRVMDIYSLLKPDATKDELMACQLHDAPEDGRVSYVPKKSMPTLALCPFKDYMDGKGQKKYSPRTIEMLTACQDPNNPDALRRDEVVNLLAALGYSNETMEMIGAVSKPPKFAKEKRSFEEKLADNSAFIESLCETGKFEDKLLKFSDALANRERQIH